MRLKDMNIGSFVTKGRGYLVYRKKATQYLYYGKESYGVYNLGNTIRNNSSIWNYSNFEYCDEDGNILKKKNKMEKDVNYIGGDYRVVEVSYDDDIVSSLSILGYYFKCDIDTKVNVGDLLVVESANGFDVVKAVNIWNNCLENAEIVKQAKAWVIDVIDYTKQQQRKEATERRAYIIQQLEEKKEQLEAISMYKLLVDSVAEAAKLVEELKQIGN